MDLSKKRKIEENGVVSGEVHDSSSNSKLSPHDARKIIDRFTPDQLLDILQEAMIRHPDVLESVRSIADSDTSQRKLFIRGLGWDTTTDGLRSLFSAYGELEEAVVILDKTTGKSKGYGFVTFRHVDGAFLALKEPSKKIDGRMTVTQLAAAGNSGTNTTAPVSVADVSLRKIYVANVPYEMASDKLLAHFALYGEIEEGPLGFDKQTGKCRGYALFVYKTPEGAQAALVDPVKTIEGRQLNWNASAHQPGGGQFSGPGGMGSYAGFSGPPSMGHHHHNNPVGMSAVGNQAASSLGGSGGGYGGPFSGYGGGPGSAGYGGLGGGPGGVGGGASSMYRLPPNSGGGPSGGYPESGHYGLSSSSAYPGQHHHQSGTSPLPRGPPGGMYPPPPYY
uniref:RRM domain-containing protein n=1 Tax=Cannabis sativa TaxID=3483 RepID=A0A803QHL2_CANSA